MEVKVGIVYGSTSDEAVMKNTKDILETYEVGCDNDELGQLKTALDAGCGILKKGGRIAVISFHSLEDRIVKNRFRDESTGCHCPPGLPVCRCGHTASLRIVTRKPVTPGEAELARNRRSACAKLRAAEKIV